MKKNQQQALVDYLEELDDWVEYSDLQRLFPRHVIESALANGLISQYRGRVGPLWCAPVAVYENRASLQELTAPARFGQRLIVAYEMCGDFD